MGAKDILLAWVFEARSASTAAVSPLIKHKRWHICCESGLKHNTGRLWWIRRRISSGTSVVCCPECVSVLACGPTRSPIRADNTSLPRHQALSDSHPFKKTNNKDDLRWSLGLRAIWDYVGDLPARLLICWKCVDFKSVGMTLSVSVGLIKYICR